MRSPGLFRHPEDRIPVLLILGLFAIDLTVYAMVDNVWVLLVWSLASIGPKAGVCAFNHHHQHVPTFTTPVLNRALELVYFLQTGVCGHAWVLHHSLGHHVNYLDQTKDESRWARADGSRMGEWEYALITTLTAYPRAWKVGARYPRQRRVFLMMMILSVATLVGLIALRPLAGLLVFGLTPALALFGTALATYVHHSDRDTDHHLVASNNILQPFYNWLTGNLGYHTAHHQKPGVHWSQLPTLHAEIAAEIPAVAFIQPGVPWKWAGASEGAAAAEQARAQGQQATEAGRESAPAA